ncbi:MAG: hypothetical protein R6U17_06075 [Thermoplasmata archaeon]
MVIRKSLRLRLMVIVISVLILLLLFVWHGSLEPDPDVNRYPKEKDIIGQPSTYIGEKVVVGGEVVSTNPLIMEIEWGDDTMELLITGVQEEPKEGDRLTVFGTLEEEHTVHASEHVVQPFMNYVYMYAVSFVAAAWVAYRMIKQFSWDGDDKMFEPKEDDHG